MLDPGSPMEVRVATASDAESIARLVNLAFEVESTFKIGDRTDVDEIHSYLSTGEFLVSVDPGGAMVACIYVESEGARGYFGMLSVEPSLQRAGMGRRLIEMVEERCRGRGCTVMEIQIVNHRTELIAYYGRFGYTEVGTKPFAPEAVHKLKLPSHFVKLQKPL